MLSTSRYAEKINGVFNNFFLCRRIVLTTFLCDFEALIQESKNELKKFLFATGDIVVFRSFQFNDVAANCEKLTKN